MEREPDKRTGIGWKPIRPNLNWMGCKSSAFRQIFPGCEPDKRAGAVLKTDGALTELGEHALRIPPLCDVL